MKDNNEENNQNSQNSDLETTSQGDETNTEGMEEVFVNNQQQQHHPYMDRLEQGHSDLLSCSGGGGGTHNNNFSENRINPYSDEEKSFFELK